MPTSGLGSRVSGAGPLTPKTSGFTLVELLVVIAVVAVAIGLIAIALPDGERSRLEEEAERLAALLETARAEARVSGQAVYWQPASGDAPGGSSRDAAQDGHFRFVGLPRALALPTRWLDARTTALVPGNGHLVLGPEAILPPQRVLLSLGASRIELASDGLAPFGPVSPSITPTP
jgi:general secretion pathway protein H